MARHGKKAPRGPRKGQGSGEMIKHRGFPGRMPSTDFQFTIRRASKEGATKIVRRERYADRRALDRAADRMFLAALWAHFGEEPFARGNLDAGRLSWLFGREVVAVDDPFDPQNYEAMLRVDRRAAEAAFPEIFEEGAAGLPEDWDDFDDAEDEDDEDGEWDGDSA